MTFPMITVTDLRNHGLLIPSFQCAFIGGSRTIVDPPPTDTDLDIVIHVSDILAAVLYLEDKGFEATKSDYVDENCDFTTLRRGEVNILLVQQAYEFGALLGATSYAKSINMKEKSDRYDFFERVRLPWRS